MEPPAPEVPVPEDVPVLIDSSDDDLADDENESAQQGEPVGKQPRQGSGKNTPQVQGQPDSAPPDAQQRCRKT